MDKQFSNDEIAVIRFLVSEEKYDLEENHGINAKMQTLILDKIQAGNFEFNFKEKMIIERLVKKEIVYLETNTKSSLDTHRSLLLKVEQKK